MKDPIVPKQALSTAQRVTRREFANFFETFSGPNAPTNWPGMSDQELLNATADALFELGKKRGKGFAMWQTFIYEMQDRLDETLRPRPRGKTIDPV